MQPLLSSALGTEFQFFFEAKEEGVNRLLSEKNCHIMILDLNSNHDSLKERIACARGLMASDVAWVILADDGLRVTANELVRLGAFGYCRRPPSIRDLRLMLRRAHEHSLAKRQSEQEAVRMEEIRDRDQMVGASQPMQHVHHLIDCVADVDASVLITGESGTGKELVARAIHNRGNRSGRPFIAVACGAIPETLIEAELFGHEKGAYTGTVGSREGYLEQSRRRNAVPGRDRRTQPVHAGEAAARVAAARVQPPGQQSPGPAAVAADLRHSPQPGGNGGRRASSARISTTAST